MALETLPSYANISELQLRIVSPDDAGRLVANLKIPAASKYRELWAGQVAFAAMSVATLNKFLGWLDQFDGRLTAFGITLANGVASIAPTHTATLASTTTAGQASLALTCSPTSGTIKAGTLLTIGTNTADAYQVVEVLADATVTAGAATVEVSPRIRWIFSAGATVTLGATNLRVRLASDDIPGHKFNPSHGVITLDVIEAVHA